MAAKNTKKTFPTRVLTHNKCDLNKRSNSKACGKKTLQLTLSDLRSTQSPEGQICSGLHQKYGQKTE